MNTVFVNLPVRDVAKSKDFFAKLGFECNPSYTIEHAACLILNEGVSVMLLEAKQYENFTNKKALTPTDTSEVIIAYDVESRERANEVVDIAVQSGGKKYKEPMEYGWMYVHGFEDLDGHLWEVGCMDESKRPW